MQRPLLNDPDEPPDDRLLSQHLGAAKAAWDELASDVTAAVDGVQLSWRYYPDGKAWLCKAARKGRTICWISVWDGAFRTTFYFGQRCDAEIEQLAIDATLKEAYAATARTGKLKPLSVEVRDRRPLPDLYALMRFKATGP
jgi:hypothetical protein